MKYAISILTYSAVEHSKRCIASVIANSNMDSVRFILTANGNKEALDYFNVVKEEYPSTIVVWNETNEGFIKPNNHALTLCEEEFFVLLNDDVVIGQSDWLDVLSKPFTEFKDAALVGPGGGCQSLLPNFHGTIGRNFEYLEGSVLICKTEVLKKHGLFPDWLEFAYGEDSHLSLRMRELGYTLHKRPFKYSHARCQTSKTVPQVRLHEAKNHEKLRKRWAHYLSVRKMDYPIIVRRNAAWGDVLLTTPIIQRIKEERPLSPIYVQGQCGAVLSRNPNVAGCGRAIPEGGLLIDLDMAYEKRQNVHIVDAYADVLKSTTGIDGVKRIIKTYPAEHDYKAMRGHEGKYAVHIGPTSWASKNWPIDHWNAVIEYLGDKAVLVGHRTDIRFDGCADLRGATTMLQLAALLANCKALITVDSLPLHIAQSVGCPVIGLFGITDPQYILTDGSKAIGLHGECESFGLRHRSPNTTIVEDGGKAMGTISTDMVISAIKTL